ncbi:formate dehydrogenase accessory sulfurtransferase FdhD [Methylocapsa sp. D3K7]|uniref:formate dehydrogenase accessory sulfurtransferase FdhD n=1 Tax=Methylocapsa sp. D3K7 TaxID=3041435 RepID=UPI00244EE82D|nr:formate dehydrogenase accessory sulfurtransferase FdhD [Methylocapsa sp. D3K7]WGJ15742.1 formate dehydrogenase accessory sulfurtransferase FdhD [Methylocapsa sp. D3K7]
MTGDTIDDGGSPLPPPSHSVACLAWREGEVSPSVRSVPEETAIAFTFNGTTHAVMMATPADLEDFAIGFALTEGLIEAPSEIASLDIVTTPLGIELRIWLPENRAKTYAARRRSMAGPTGCGLCGIESLEEAARPAPVVSNASRFDSSAIVAAMASLSSGQKLNRETHAVHAAGFWVPSRGLAAVREDVGRHNALDKLIGALVRAGEAAAHGIVLLTSRVSIELIQKAARLGAPVVAAVSVPTAAGVRLAEASGLTLVAIARGQDFEVFTHPQRIIDRAQHHVA